MRPFTLTIYDALRLLYMVFFKPISLERYIHQVDPTLGANPSLFTVWWRRREHPEFRPLILLACLHIISLPLLAFPVAGLFTMLGFEVNWIGTMVFGIGFGVAFGVGTSITSGIVGGMAFGMAAGVGIGIGYGIRITNVEGMTATSVIIGVAIGITCGVVFSKVAESITAKVAIGILLGVAGSILLGVAGSIGGIAFGISSVLSYFRLPLYFLQSLTTWLAVRRDNLTWRYSPVLWDEMIWFPLLGLDAQLIAIGKHDRAAGLDAITAVAQSFNQGWAAKRALAELTLYDVQNAHTLESIGAIAENLLWLPAEGRNDLKSFLPGIEQISQHARAAFESDTLYNRQEQLRSALKVIGQMREGVAYYPDRRFAGQAGPALQGWEQIFQRELNTANQKEQIPNVYVAGSPLAEQSKVFKGRRDVFRALERELTGEAAQRPAILLFGARRSGKSSALKQLPVMLGPQVIPVTVDLQSLALTNGAAGFLGKMAAEIKSAALIARRFDLPDLPPKDLQADPYAAFADWLK